MIQSSRSLSVGELGTSERVCHAPHEPHWTYEQVRRVLEERWLIAFNRVSKKLKEPADDKERERPPPVEKEERQRDDDQRNAYAVREPVQRMPVLLFVILHKRCWHINLQEQG